ncbi:hypothetical protein [Streptococcus massiliensis]|uniref:Helicase superfamily protein n=1 Tax=Streptococcus massiliensis TaxID=313439 RepID=A0A380KZG8_9STRE|nr:hypothetical protein [Streptococcus massiliensis]SUN77393.1 helicase superfamily protein [Streptococcus massiliensis]
MGLEEVNNYIQVYLKGANQRESHLFANCLEEFFSDIDNQRYIIKQESAQGTIYYAVPSIFAGKKREAQLFLTYMQSYLGKSELIYTRNEAGRKVLFQARMSKRNQDFALTKKQIRVRK